jgi:hypothetical protein
VIRIETRDTFEFFEHCARERFDHPWRMTCDRCGITCAAHFEHPQRRVTVVLMVGL